ncbi:hypothetical protein PG985_014320 [Apiospora marii]|uniref:uncharacterized protein n=1 Tax=Apiospora marii TaxID=335849 RepID=UPI0031307F67
MPASSGYSWPWWPRKLLGPRFAAQEGGDNIRFLSNPLIPTSSPPGDLPFEIFLQVAGVIYQEHRPSLSALAQVNKMCYAAAMVWRLRSIRFEVTKREQLRRDVDNFLRVVKPTEGVKHVRWLEVRGCLAPTVAGEVKIKNRARGPVLQDHIYDGTTRDVFSEPVYADFDYDGPIEVLPEEDSAWQPVVDLLKALSHLEDFVFTSEENQFPPSLLRALQKHHPACRLHLPFFRFRSLRGEATDPHEMAIVCSPLLHSIGVKWVDVNFKKHDDWNRQAVMRLISSGMAPNLKRVNLTHSAPMAGGKRYGPYRPDPPWKGFTPGPWNRSAGMARAAPLQYLTIFDYNSIRVSHLTEWQQHNAFQKLTDLTFITQVSGEALEWATLNASFPHLKHLTMKFIFDEGDDGAPNFDSPAAAFLASLKPLESLRLTGNIDNETIDSILSRHGPTLQSLTLDPISSQSPSTGPRHQPSTYGRDHILQLRDACLRLEKLSLPIRRQKGKRAEVAIYRTLGEIPSLTDITLELSSSSGGVEEPREPFGDPFKDMHFEKALQFHERPMRNGDVMVALLNCALDETLARAIWDVVAGGKAGRPLRSLRLGPRGGTAYGQRGTSGGFKTVLEHLQRGYLLERSVRDDDADTGRAATPTVVELDRKAREAWDEQQRESRRDYIRRYAEIHPAQPSPPPSTCLEEVLKRLWPAKEGSYDWRDDWESLPLDMGQD